MVLHDASPSGLACFEQVRAGYAAAPDGPLRVRSMGLVPGTPPPCT
ncbi:hypothetical protein ACFQ0M_05490 [Kitasatospora aburaviensis]